MNYALTQHACDVLQERHIAVEWMERALSKPSLVHPSPTDSTVESRFAKIPEHGNRILRVVVNKTVVPERVVSV